MINLLVSNFLNIFQNDTSTPSSKKNKLEPSSSDLSTQPLFDDSPVPFLETIDQVYANPSEQLEQTEHNTPSKVHTPPDTTNELPPPCCN